VFERRTQDGRVVDLAEMNFRKHDQDAPNLPLQVKVLSAARGRPRALAGAPSGTCHHRRSSP